MRINTGQHLNLHQAPIAALDSMLFSLAAVSLITASLATAFLREVFREVRNSAIVTKDIEN